MFAPLTAIDIDAAKHPASLSTLTVVSLLGGPQWQLVVALVAGYVVVTVVALRTAEPAPGSNRSPRGPWACTWLFATMLAANVFHEGGIALYIVVQTVGLVATAAIVAFPALATHRRGEATLERASTARRRSPSQARCGRRRRCTTALRSWVPRRTA